MRCPSRRGRATALAASLVVAVTGACRVEVSVGVEADADGTGRVRAAAVLDAEAVERLVGEAAGDPATSDPATRIKIDDLREAGWTVTGPEATAGGGLQVVATQRYRDAPHARRLLDEVGGDPGPFRDVTIRQSRTFFKTTTHFTGTVDLGDGLAAFTDADLRQALEATDEAPLGVTAEQLEARLGAPVDRMLGLQVAVRLPGTVTSNAPTQTGDGAVWSPPLGEELVLEASSQRWNAPNLVALAMAVASVLALVLFATVVLRRRSRLTVTDGNLTLGSDGAPAADGRRT